MNLISRSKKDGIYRRQGIEIDPIGHKYQGSKAHHNPICRRVGCPHGDSPTQPARLTMRATNGLCLPCWVQERKRLRAGLGPFPRIRSTSKVKILMGWVENPPSEAPGAASAAQRDRTGVDMPAEG